MTKIKILTPKQIQEEYKINIKVVYEISNSKGCPIVPGGKGKHFRIERTAFENYIKGGRQCI